MHHPTRLHSYVIARFWHQSKNESSIVISKKNRSSIHILFEHCIVRDFRICLVDCRSTIVMAIRHKLQSETRFTILRLVAKKSSLGKNISSKKSENLFFGDELIEWWMIKPSSLCLQREHYYRCSASNHNLSLSRHFLHPSIRTRSAHLHTHTAPKKFYLVYLRSSMDNFFFRLMTFFAGHRDEFDQYLKTIFPWASDYTKLEKDLYLTAILNQLAVLEKWYVFKWGTCLNKCHFGYYRLSEDLDFSLLVGDANRTQRSKHIQAFFDDVTTICQWLWLTCIDQRKRDTSHFGEMKREYQSLITQTPQMIIFDIKTYSFFHRDPVMLPIRDIYTDPLLKTDIFPKKSILCMSLEEAMAEKMRAALTRTTPAIRDFYDIWYARKQWFDFAPIADLIHRKVEEVGNIITIWSPDVFRLLSVQVQTDLAPVVFDLDDFDLREMESYVMSFAP